MLTAGFGDDVEVLAAEYLGADVRPDPLHPALTVGRQVRTRDDVVGPNQGQIAEQDRRRPAELVGGPAPAPVAVQIGELHVRGRHTAAGGRVVDHVVVNQRAGVQQFQRGEQPEYPVVDAVLRPGGDRPIAPVRESRTQPLAAAQHEVLQRGDQAVVIRADVRRVGASAPQIPPKLVGDGAGQLGGRRSCCLHAQRGTPLSRRTHRSGC